MALSGLLAHLKGGVNLVVNLLHVFYYVFFLLSFPGPSGTVSDPKVRYIARRKQTDGESLPPPCYVSHFWV